MRGNWTYNSFGHATSIKYPYQNYAGLVGRREVNHTFDDLGRLIGVDTKLPTPQIPNPSWQAVISGVQFNAFGAVTSLSHLGNTEVRQYNVLGQMTRLSKGGLIDMEYRFSATANDGKIVSQKNWISGEDVVFQYDELERLISASTVAGTSWGLSWSYDGFGNRLSQTVTQGTWPSSVVLVNGSTNRISSSGYSYDANGNMTMMPKGSGAMSMSYDLSNRLASVVGTDFSEQYVYAPDNRRVWTSNGRFIFYAPNGKKMGVYVGDFSQNITTIMEGAVEENVYYGSRLVAKWTLWSPSSLVSDFTTDRLQSKGNGSGYFPYGESKTGAAGTDQEEFATYTRSAASGLDYADQRWYVSGVGRFSSVDPLAASFFISKPVSANRYVYGESDPSNSFDPSGLLLESPGGSASRDFESCYLDGKDYCGGNVGGGLGGLSITSPQDLATVYGLIQPGESLNSQAVDWTLLMSGVSISLSLGETRSAHLSVLENLAFIQPNSVLPGVVAIPVLIDIGALINSTGAAITIGLLWETVKEFLKQRPYRVQCSVHRNGTANHESVGRIVRSGVIARSASEAIAVAKPNMEFELNERFGPGHHLQHCGAN